MVWGKVDDKLHAHPKPERAGVAAMGLWVLALSHCCAVLTDGHVSRERAARLAGKDGPKLAAKLCEAGFWHPSDAPCPSGHAECDAARKAGDGWRFHDWADYQPTRAAVEAERARKQEAGRAGGLRKAEAASRKLAGASHLPAEPPKHEPGTQAGNGATPVPVPVPVPVPGPGPRDPEPDLPPDPPAPPEPAEPVASPPGGAADAADAPASEPRPKRRRQPGGDDADEQPAGYAAVVATYFDAFAAARGAKPAFDARAGKAAKGLLASLGEAGAIAAIRAAYADPFWAPKATICTIAADPSRHVGGARQAAPLRLVQPAENRQWTPPEGAGF